MAYTAHGHQIPGTIAEAVRPERVARCGGVNHCKQCKKEAELAVSPSSTADATAWAQSKNAEKNADSQKVDWDIDANRPAEIIPMESELEKELGHLLNRHSAENESGTPDFILAMFLRAQLDLFNQTIRDRAAWRGESVELPALQKLHADVEMTKKAAAYFKQLVDSGVIVVHTPLEATDIYREIMDMQYPPSDQDLTLPGFEAGDTLGPDDVLAPGALDGNDGKEVPLVMYEDGRRNEIGTAKVHVTPGEVRVTGTINAAIPIFTETDLHPSVSVEEPKEEPSNRFDRYQKKGLSENG